MPFGVEKLEWCRYAMVEKLMICLFVLTQLTNVTDTRTHTQTDTRAYNSEVDKDICTKFCSKMHHGHAERITSIKVETGS